MHLNIMNKRIFLLPLALLFAFSFLPAQLEPREVSGEEARYGSKFFDQLHIVFGRFQDSDLQRAFQAAQRIQCPELVAGKGEWRPVAFFNEDRTLGDWCLESLEEVKANLDVFTFKGECREDVGTIEVATEFPTDESIEDFNQGRIKLSQIDITANDPVTSVFSPKTMAYTFDLPYLFFKSQKASTKTYSLNAPNRNAVYATDVSNHWECKAISSKDLTYRFLICRTSTVLPGGTTRNKQWEPSFGSSAFFILSDGIETRTSVKIIFGDGTSSTEQPTEQPADTAPRARTRPVLKRE
jgi:hypothetical protein